MVQHHHVEDGRGLATVIVRDRERDGLVARNIPSHNGVRGTAAHRGEVIVSGRRPGSNANTVREGPSVGEKFTVVIHKHIWKDQAGVGHGGQRLCVDLDRDPVVDLNEKRLRPDVDAIGDRQGEGECFALTVDLIPFVLLRINANTAALRAIAPIPLEVKVVDGNIVDRAAC